MCAFGKCYSSDEHLVHKRMVLCASGNLTVSVYGEELCLMLTQGHIRTGDLSKSV